MPWPSKRTSAPAPMEIPSLGAQSVPSPGVQSVPSPTGAWLPLVLGSPTAKQQSMAPTTPSMFASVLLLTGWKCVGCSALPRIQPLLCLCRRLVVV
ncbi:hypothetical protein PVAP13_6NG267600 [Panicum virgatum]|uniref:Uncharacterized protein n=1 Tax=Panicum virgatum TaxID=38727 RepID=A0A8T0QXP4_PANVG|nr:hypothetical protein PVAP13_6NG267600 [Panicum virgatum]KAG2577961.1 hypothetical protein PVAP13_6NG267600 [Panicum virgatum]